MRIVPVLQAVAQAVVVVRVVQVPQKHPGPVEPVPPSFGPTAIETREQLRDLMDDTMMYRAHQIYVAHTDLYHTTFYYNGDLKFDTCLTHSK